MVIQFFGPAKAACMSLKKTSVLSMTPVKREEPQPNAETGMSDAVCAALVPGTWPVTIKLPAASRFSGPVGQVLSGGAPLNGCWLSRNGCGLVSQPSLLFAIGGGNRSAF